jgi:hypothetical protein
LTCLMYRLLAYPRIDSIQNFNPDFVGIKLTKLVDL